mmetsp:Transcript_8934/g.21161  ORF Transcript_8934/g.21161 Transcript_8934/m.21161 type:complete len:245 (+) Transcript_8934:375-1109(+)
MGSKDNHTGFITASLEYCPADSTVLEGMHATVFKHPQIAPKNNVSVPLGLRVTSTSELPNVSRGFLVQFCQDLIPFVPKLLQGHDLWVYLEDGLCNLTCTAQQIVGIVDVPGQESCGLSAVLTWGRGRRWRWRRCIASHLHAPAFLSVHIFTLPLFTTDTCQAFTAIKVVPHLIDLAIGASAGTSPSTHFGFAEIFRLVVPILSCLKGRLLPDPGSVLQQQPGTILTFGSAIVLCCNLSQSAGQ